MKRRVVVTGIGLVSPVGNTTESTWEALTAGKSGAAPIETFDTAEFSVKFACEVKGFDPLEYMERKEAKRADRYAHYAVAAAEQALVHAGYNGSKPDGDRTGVIIGSGVQ